MERAIRLGGETDTAAALVGGLVGATFGFEAIPTSLLFALRSRSLAGHLVDRLLSRAPSGLEPRHLAVDWLEADSIQSGRLGIAGLPGRGPNSRDRVRRRLLATDADHLASLGVTLLVLLVMDHELEPLRPDAYVAALVERGISVVREPVAELDVPVSRDAFRSALDAAEEALSRGERVVVACGTGRGRASTFAACVLRDEGVPADEALAIVSGNRPRAIETAAQEAFVRGWP
jgi:ADP-ribosyl-[dinitrogen reductase] hydrolase